MTIVAGEDAPEQITVPLLCDYHRIEEHLVNATVRLFGGNKTAAAKALGMHRRTLYRVLKRVEPRGPHVLERSA